MPTDVLPLSPQAAFTGATVNFVYRNAAGQVWNTTGPAFEAFVDANYNAGEYNVTATEQGTSATYQATVPAGITVSYFFTAYKRVSGTISTDLAVGGSDLPCPYQSFANSTANPATDGSGNAVATATTATAIKAKTDLIATNGGDGPAQQTAQSTIATNLNATVGSRSTYAGGAGDTNAAAIKAKTDQLTFTVPNKVDASSVSITVVVDPPVTVTPNT